MEDIESFNINMVYNTQCIKIYDDPINVLHEKEFIQHIIEDPPHVTSIENIDDWEFFHVYFSDDDHICTQDQSQDETIR